MSAMFDMLEEHPATQALRKRGLTSDQLHSVRFFKFNSEIPIDEQAITWTAIPQALDADYPSLLRQYATYRYALEDGLKADDAKGMAQAFRIAADDFAAPFVAAAPFIAMGIAHQAAQKAKAKKSRGMLRDLDKTIFELVAEFVRKPVSYDMTAKELWSPFFSYLDEEGLAPKDYGNRYTYDFNGKRRPMAWRTFERHVRRARRNMAH